MEQLFSLKTNGAEKICKWSKLIALVCFMTSKYVIILLCLTIFSFTFLQPVLLATLSCVTPNSSVVAQGFGRRLGLADFATNDLLRQSRASTSLEEPEQQSIEGRQLPFQPQSAPRQRQLRPMLRQPLSKGRPISKRNRPSRINSFEDESSNIVQQGWGQQGRKSVRVGFPNNFVPYDQRREENSKIPHTKRFGPNDGFTWPKDFGNFHSDSIKNRRSGLDQTFGYFSSALRLLSYLVRNIQSIR